MDSNSPKATEAELARMMEQYGARLAAVCALMLGDRDLAQDIVQETFIRAYQRLECFRGERQESERAWLTSIAVNLCKNERKKSWFRFIDRKTPIDALNLPTEDAPQEKKLLYMVVQTLPQKECELILLRYYQKLTVAEISKILHRSPATIYRGLEHAHRLLKKALEHMLEKGLSDFDFSLERRQAVLQTIRKKENPVVKRKASAVLILAVVLSLLIGGAALAATLGIFGHAAESGKNEQSVNRLQKLETASEIYNDTQAANAPAPVATEAPKNTYDALIAALCNSRFELTLNQAYYDGYKLYYAYTLTRDGQDDFISGEDMPTGFTQWDSMQEGFYATSVTATADSAIDPQISAYFAEHPIGYIAYLMMNVGDGADMDGKPLTILDSGMERIDSHTIQGFQEVKLPDGFEPTDVLSIDLIVSYNMHVWAQDGQNIYHTILRTPENRGFFRLPFSVKLNGQTETYTGSIQTRAYNAQATIRMSDVDLSGEVVFDAPEWAMAFEADSDGKHLMNMPYIHNYTLIADGVELPNLDGGFGVNRDGQFFIQIRYNLPESLNSLTLVPTGTGLGESATAERENEEIILFQSSSAL